MCKRQRRARTCVINRSDTWRARMVPVILQTDTSGTGYSPRLHDLAITISHSSNGHGGSNYIYNSLAVSLDALSIMGAGDVTFAGKTVGMT